MNSGAEDSLLKDITSKASGLNVSVTEVSTQGHVRNDVVMSNEVFHLYTAGIVGSVFVVLGIIGNSLSVCVLSCSRMRRGSASVCRLLVGLAAYDTVFLFAQGLAGNLPHVLHYTGHKMGSPGAVLFVVCYPILHMGRTGSVYTTVMVTIERCIAVMKPLKASIMFTHARTNRILIAIFAFTVVFNIPRCIENVLVMNDNKITVQKSSFLNTVFYSKVYLIYLNFIFHFVIPFFLIAVFNILIIYTLRKVTKEFAIGNKDSSCTELNSKSSQRSSTETGNKLAAIVLAVTTMFFLCHLVPAIGLVLEQTENAYRLGECSATCSNISSLGEMLIIVCSATNFILYCLFGRKFRQVFKSIFCPCISDLNKGGYSRKSHVHSLKSFTLMETNA